MIKVIKTLVIGFALISPVLAENVMCPQSITCNYEEGVCLDESGNHLEKKWYIFPNQKINNGESFVLNRIDIQTGDTASSYEHMYSDIKFYHLLGCVYLGENNTTIWLSRFVKLMKGDGITRSGFGNHWASCTQSTPVANPSLCYGEI